MTSLISVSERTCSLLLIFPCFTGEAVGSPIDKEDGIDSNGFYFQMSVAQFGIWLSFTIWIMLLTFSVVKLCRYHHEENLRVSMAKERKRLLNEDLVSEVSVPVLSHVTCLPKAVE